MGCLVFFLSQFFESELRWIFLERRSKKKKWLHRQDQLGVILNENNAKESVIFPECSNFCPLDQMFKN